MEEILNELKAINANAKKKVNQPYSRETVENKKKEIEYLENEYRKYLEDTDRDKDDLLADFIQVKEEAISTLKVHIDKRNQTKIVVMATLDLNELSTIKKFIPIYSGKKEELHDFIGNIKLVYEAIETGRRQSFFDFVFNHRLELKVQNRVKQVSVPRNIDELITALKTSYKPVQSANSVLNELTKIVQKVNNLMGFAARIESLVAELNEIQIAEAGETYRSSITTTNSNIAFNSFINGLADPQILATIDASRVKTFAEALEIAEAIDSRGKNGQIMYQTARTSQNRDNECNKCGRTHGNRCPAQGKKCNKCGKLNHFANKCFTTNRNNNNNSNNRNNYRNNNSSRDSNRRNNDNNSNRNNNNRNTRNINHVQDQENYQDPETSRPGTPENNY